VSCAENQDSGKVETLKVYTPNRTAKFWSDFCSARDEKPKQQPEKPLPKPKHEPEKPKPTAAPIVKTASPHHSQNYLYILLVVIAVTLVLLWYALNKETCTGTAGTENKTLLTGSPEEGKGAQ